MKPRGAIRLASTKHYLHKCNNFVPSSYPCPPTLHHKGLTTKEPDGKRAQRAADRSTPFASYTGRTASRKHSSGQLSQLSHHAKQGHVTTIFEKFYSRDNILRPQNFHKQRGIGSVRLGKKVSNRLHRRTMRRGPLNQAAGCATNFTRPTQEQKQAGYKLCPRRGPCHRLENSTSKRPRGRPTSETHPSNRPPHSSIQPIL